MDKIIPNGLCGVYCGQCPVGKNKMNALIKISMPSALELTSDGCKYPFIFEQYQLVQKEIKKLQFQERIVK